ncbi:MULTISPECIES: rod shape-determining protein MreD [Marinimicrobium]|jgi:rod shape-determining protein MreD|uniref:Rod shape-determining protein MreD n=1 Tax=Marinimicrobium koreense TaxID=306545 RepID=A0A3N1P238_9GAMM|nr:MULTISPECIES: rod shape-determining protein MreD [Marinimicrobium]MAN53274.1 rod shape-determining protein MreD [Marinimicrobium sp.]ROQ20790.1 rod shape-determining protein MreD [Marinimicrobium koreense]
MIDLTRGHNRWLVLVALLLALTLAVYPLPLDWRWWRPEFVMLVVVYWVFTLPDHVSLTQVALLGLIQDLVEGTPLGQHALGLVIVTYIALQSYRRFGNYALWQQACWVFVLVGIAQMTSNWVHSLAGGHVSGLQFLYPALVSAVLWPLVHIGFGGLRHRYRIQ